MGPVESKIKDKIINAFSPDVLEIQNDSEKHLGHAGYDGTGESHFQITIVSESFVDKSRIDRYRMIHDALEDEHKTIHSLAFTLKTPEEYQP